MLESAAGPASGRHRQLGRSRTPTSGDTLAPPPQIRRQRQQLPPEPPGPRPHLTRRDPPPRAAGSSAGPGLTCPPTPAASGNPRYQAPTRRRGLQPTHLRPITAATSPGPGHALAGGTSNRRRPAPVPHRTEDAGTRRPGPRREPPSRFPAGRRRPRIQPQPTPGSLPPDYPRWLRPPPADRPTTHQQRPTLAPPEPSMKLSRRTSSGRSTRARRRRSPSARP